MTYLLPCPFCGETPIVDNTENHSEAGGPDSWLVCCGSFACYGNAFTLDNTFHSREHACEAWNTRTPMRPPPTPEQLAAEKASLDAILAAVDESRTRMNTKTDVERAELERRARARVAEGTSKGAEIVERYRPKMNNLTAAEREEYYLRGMQRIYTKWWPIASAPKDGTYILLAGPSGYAGTPLRVEVCRWDPEYRPHNPWQTYADNAFEDGGAPATHWMPLPPAP